jgi:hypothetical protein
MRSEVVAERIRPGVIDGVQWIVKRFGVVHIFACEPSHVWSEVFVF